MAATIATTRQAMGAGSGSLRARDNAFRQVVESRSCLTQNNVVTRAGRVSPALCFSSTQSLQQEKNSDFSDRVAVLPQHFHSAIRNDLRICMDGRRRAADRGRTPGCASCCCARQALLHVVLGTRSLGRLRLAQRSGEGAVGDGPGVKRTHGAAAHRASWSQKERVCGRGVRRPWSPSCCTGSTACQGVRAQRRRRQTPSRRRWPSPRQTSARSTTASTNAQSEAVAVAAPLRQRALTA